LPDLFELASGNSTHLEREWDKLVSRLAPEERETAVVFFETVAGQGRVAINLKPHELDSFLASEEYLNVHERARREDAGAAAAREESLRRALRNFYSRRVAFDRSFEGGEDFIYGALSIGGLGAVKYGDFCMILRTPGHSGRKVAYLKVDALVKSALYQTTRLFSYFSLFSLDSERNSW
jgi:hypothetical protein